MNVWEISEKFEVEERTKGALSGTFVRWGKEIKPVWEGHGYEKRSLCGEREGAAHVLQRKNFLC
jgi:hypothetical protein